jgi:hypothetical protein
MSIMGIIIAVALLLAFAIGLAVVVAREGKGGDDKPQT